MTVAQAACIVAIFACLYAAQAATLIQNVISINGTYQQSAALPAVCVLVGSSSCWRIHDGQPVQCCLHVITQSVMFAPGSLCLNKTCCTLTLDVLRVVLFCIHMRGCSGQGFSSLRAVFACLSHVVPSALMSRNATRVQHLCAMVACCNAHTQHAVHAYRPQPKRTGSSRQIHLEFTTMSEYR